MGAFLYFIRGDFLNGGGVRLGNPNIFTFSLSQIARTRNRWKFHLKDGIMNLKSKDYVFHKANGDSEW